MKVWEGGEGYRSLSNLQPNKGGGRRRPVERVEKEQGQLMGEGQLSNIGGHGPTQLLLLDSKPLEAWIVHH